MAKTITYTQQGDYLLPDLKLPEQPKVEIGVFGQRHKRYLKEQRHILPTLIFRQTKCTICSSDSFPKRKT